MSWPALLEAKNNIRNISAELDKLLRESNSMSKKDLVKYKETLLSKIDESILLIEQEMEQLDSNLKKHRKYAESKSVFLRRHHKML